LLLLLLMNTFFLQLLCWLHLQLADWAESTENNGKRERTVSGRRKTCAKKYR